MWWYREGNKEQGWRRVGTLSPSIVHILVWSLGFEWAISPLILLFSTHYPYSLPLFQNYYKRPFYYPSFYHLPRLIILFLFKKVVGKNILQIWIGNYPRKKEPQMIQIHPFKKKEKEGGEGRSPLGGQWKVPMFGHQWKEKEKHLFISSHFPFNKFYLNLQFFPLILRFYFTMVLGHYLCISFLFLDL